MRSLRRGCSPGRAAGQSGGRSLPPAAENSRQTIEQQVSRAPRPARQPLSPTNPEAKPVIVAGWMGHGRQPALAEHRHLVSTGRRAVYTDMFNRVITACRPWRRRDCLSNGIPLGHSRKMGSARRTATAQRDRRSQTHQAVSTNTLPDAGSRAARPGAPCCWRSDSLAAQATCLIWAGCLAGWRRAGRLSPSTRSRLVIAAGGLGVVPRGFGEALEMREQGRGGRRIGEDRPVR